MILLLKMQDDPYLKRNIAMAALFSFGKCLVIVKSLEVQMGMLRNSRYLLLFFDF